MAGCMPSTIITSETVPSLSITKSTNPLPVIGSISGYLKCLLIKSRSWELFKEGNALITSDSS